MSKWYSRADVVVVCSGAEAFGRVTVEAQMAGCLVIGADKGATIEIIEDQKTGYLYEYGNAKDLSMKIKNVFQDKSSARKIAEIGKNKAKRIFTKKHNVDEIIKIYDQILKN